MITDFFNTDDNAKIEPKMKVGELSDNSSLKIQYGFFKLSKEDFEKIWKLHPEKHHEIVMMGRKVKIPRWQDLYSDNQTLRYNFSGSYITAKPLVNATLRKILNKVQKMYMNEDGTPKYKYNAVFLNWYSNGNHYIGAHSDDEKDFVDDAPIISITFGATRTFRIYKKIANYKIRKLVDYKLLDGMCAQMCGDFQKEFKHEILKEPQLQRSPN